MFCSADGSVRMIGMSPLSLGSSSAACGLPPVSWMKGTPVMPCCDSLALVSTLTGVSALSLSRAITRRASSRSRLSLSTVPTPMPLYCTLPPSVRPVTGSLKITSYCRQLRSELNFAAHSANSSRHTAVSRVKAPIST